MIASDTVAALLADATSRLAAALTLETREARIEARVLLAHALEVDHAWLIGHDRDALLPAQQSVIANLITRRAKGEPVAYILGEREFFGRTFNVTPDVLIPRPETELLVEAALKRLPPMRPARILDLGTGSGCIAISLALERPDCLVTAVDISQEALTIAADNATRLGAKVDFLASDWFSALPRVPFDLILSNPPYIEADDLHLQRGDLPCEPLHALASGTDGLEAIRKIISGASNFLAPDGYLILEHGWNQSNAVQVLLKNAGYTDTQSLADLAGLHRFGIAGKYSDQP